MDENEGRGLTFLPKRVIEIANMDIEIDSSRGRPSRIPAELAIHPRISGALQELCSRCSQINWSQFLTKRIGVATQTEWDLDVILHRARSCRLCQLLLNLVLISFGTLEGLPRKVVADTYFKPRASTGDWLLPRRERSQLAIPACKLFLGDSPSTLYLPRLRHDLLLEASSEIPPKETDRFKARRVGPYVNPDLLLFWLNQCSSLHSKSCSAGTKLKHNLSSLRLVDVQQYCVVPAPEECQFVALSYVWGSVQQPLLLKATQYALSQEGALDRIKPKPPRTIRDAMMLCRALGAKYLWVDSLCLVQDEINHNPDQIADMGLVYSAAKVTIVAGSGTHSDAGLPGIGSPRAVQHESISIQGFKFRTAYNAHTEAARTSIWNTRGWTLQEQYLSTRLLIFGHENAFFKCRECVWLEDVVLDMPRWCPETRGSDGAHGNYDWTEGGWLRSAASLKDADSPESEFQRVLRSYVGRDISKENDMLSAFSGIMKLFEPHLGEFFWGHPTRTLFRYFDWQMRGYRSKRLPSFPSWSWAGWQHEESESAEKSEIYIMPTDHSPLRFYYLSKALTFEPFDNNEYTLFRNWGKEGSTLHDHSCISSAGLNLSTLPVSLRGRLLGFSTSTAKLFVSMSAVEGSKFALTTLSGEDLGLVKLDPAWRTRQPHLLDFIISGRYNSSIYVCIMLIEWIEGVAYRIDVAGGLSIRLSVWSKCNPEGKFVVMA